MNAYTCRADKGQLIEEHDELGDVAGGHEEVYVVLTGHAVSPCTPLQPRLLRESHAGYAADDSDFDALRGDPEFPAPPG